MAHETEFAARAKRAYEIGRAKRAVRFAWIPLPLMLLADCASCKPAFTVGIGAALVITTWFLAWRGGIFERSIWPATIGGLLSFAAATCASLVGFAGNALLLSCSLGGVAAGAFLAWWARRVEMQPRSAFLVGAIYALLVGALGCTTLGIGALLGVAAGLVATTPLVFLPATSR